MSSVYYKNLGVNKQSYDVALRCLQNRGKSFRLPGTIQPTELVSTVINEHPELFYVSQKFKYMVNLLGKEVMPVYLYSPTEVVRLRAELEEVAKKIISDNINVYQSDYDKVRALHDYLKQNLEYDMAALDGGDSYNRSNADAHNIVGALIKKKCVCEGFAKAFKFLCDKINLECWVASGIGSSSLGSGPHAWNIVKINGYYHHVDVTWDNQYSDSAEMPNYGYMNLSDEEISKDHTWNRKDYPACPYSPYNYFKVNNALIDSRAQLERMLYDSIQMEEEIILFRVVRGSILEREINGCLDICIQRAAARCKYISISSFQYGGVPEQLTFFIKPNYSYR